MIPSILSVDRISADNALLLPLKLILGIRDTLLSCSNQSRQICHNVSCDTLRMNALSVSFASVRSVSVRHDYACHLQLSLQYARSLGSRGQEFRTLRKP